MLIGREKSVDLLTLKLTLTLIFILIRIVLFIEVSQEFRWEVALINLVQFLGRSFCYFCCSLGFVGFAWFARAFERCAKYKLIKADKQRLQPLATGHSLLLLLLLFFFFFVPICGCQLLGLPPINGYSLCGGTRLRGVVEWPIAGVQIIWAAFIIRPGSMFAFDVSAFHGN